VIVSPGYHHFDILDQYLHNDSDIIRSLMAVVHAGGAS
jgi:hypothetical protein